MNETVTIEFTIEQQRLIYPLIHGMKAGEATFAQVFVDGFRVKVLDAETATKVQKTIGQVEEGMGRRYAFGDIEPMESENGKDEWKGGECSNHSYNTLPCW